MPVLNRPGMSGQFSCQERWSHGEHVEAVPGRAEGPGGADGGGDPIRTRIGVGGRRSVAEKFGIGTAQKVQNWVRRAQVDAGQRSGMTVGQLSQGGVVADLRFRNAS